MIKSSDAGSREIMLTYDPVARSVSPVGCDSCQQPLQILTACVSGHLYCPQCVTRCGDCGKEACKSCKLAQCSTCARTLCKKCTGKCGECAKITCTVHRNKAGLKELCMDCSRRCMGCTSFMAKRQAKQCPSCKNDFCATCAKSKISMAGNYCTSCSKSCSLCARTQGRDAFARRSECECKSCSDTSKCLACRKQICVVGKAKKINI